MPFAWNFMSKMEKRAAAVSWCLFFVVFAVICVLSFQSGNATKALEKPFVESVTGTVIENRIKKGLFGVKNMSRQTWQAVFPDHSLLEVGPGKGVPIWKGLEIDFGDGISGKLLL